MYQVSFLHPPAQQDFVQAITRAKKLVIVLGTKKALNLAITRAESRDRTTTLAERLKEYA